MVDLIVVAILWSVEWLPWGRLTEHRDGEQNDLASRIWRGLAVVLIPLAVVGVFVLFITLLIR